MDAIFGRIYSFEVPKVKRTRSLQVIAVGISRSGTESLRTALKELGYQKVYHGWETLLPENRTHMRLHSQLIRKKYQSGVKTSNSRLTAEDFDPVFGDYDAITDNSGAIFVGDLLTEYPDAKVILNYRKDLDKWHISIMNTFGAMESS
jgi:Sulfotransferase domain